MARLTGIVRYPVKGWRGENLDAAPLTPGTGLAYDRAFAIENGTKPTAGGWTSREAFLHLARDTELIRHSATIADTAAGPVLRLGVPGAGAFEVRLTGEHRAADLDAVNDVLARVLPPGRAGPVRLTMPGVGMWDYEDTALSLINLDTVDELSRRAGRDLDPARFRANLYVAGLGAWAEFGLIGRRIRVGSAVLEVMFPTDRCRATTVDPATGDTELNLPALLASRLGHMHCGVYARVVRRGRVEPGSTVAVEDGCDDRAGDAAVAYPSTADSRRWPRRAEIVATEPAGDEVTSFWIRDPLGYASSALPGQHLRLHPDGVADTPLWRCYTISATDRDTYRISVRRDGTVSELLHDSYGAGSPLVVSGPFGRVTLDAAAGQPVLLVSAGIGLTPTVAMLRALASESADRAVRVVHVDRRPAPNGLWAEVESAVDALPGARAQRYVTRAGGPTPADAPWRAGRPTAADLAATVAALPERPTAYVCGPDGFYEDVRDALVAAGVDADEIRHEVFFSPATLRDEPRPPPEPGPYEVTFADPDDEDMTGVWEAARGTLLDVGESLGLPMPSGCRAGACGSCALPVSGTTAYVADPVVPAPDGTVLLCSAVPTGDVTVRLPSG